MNSREEGERSGGQLHLQPPRGTRSSTSRSWGARQLRLQHRNRPRIAMEGSIPGDREDQRPAAAAFHRGSARGSRSRGGRPHLLRALGKPGDLLQGLRLLPGPRQARPHRADRAVSQTRTSPPSSQGRPEAQRLVARWVPKPPWFPGESRGIATDAQAREPVRLQGISAESGKHASCLPCRRSRVRVPSAARGKAPHLRGFLLLGALARPARFEGFSGRAALDLVRVALPAMARLAVRVRPPQSTTAETFQTPLAAASRA
jgi:hypothetical protein